MGSAMKQNLYCISAQDAFRRDTQESRSPQSVKQGGARTGSGKLSNYRFIVEYCVAFGIFTRFCNNIG